MIKKLLFIILFFPICVLAVETDNYVEDKFYVEEANINVKILGKDSYLIEEQYKTRLVYGTTSQRYYFERQIQNNYSYSFKGNEYEYTILPTINFYESPVFVDCVSKEKYYECIYGEQFKLFKEVENFKLNYEIGLKDKKDGIYSYFLGGFPYETKKITFEIVAPFKLKNKELYFSLDGKNFGKEIVGLSTTTEEDILIKGVYNKPLGKDKGIYFMLYDPAEVVIVEKSSNNYTYLIIGGLALLFGVSAFIILKKAKKK